MHFGTRRKTWRNGAACNAPFLIILCTTIRLYAAGTGVPRSVREGNLQRQTDFDVIHESVLAGWHDQRAGRRRRRRSGHMLAPRATASGKGTGLAPIRSALCRTMGAGNTTIAVLRRLICRRQRDGLVYASLRNGLEMKRHSLLRAVLTFACACPAGC